MKLKKLNALLGLLSILFMLLHILYSVFTYLSFYYNPLMTKLFAVPFLVIVCLHAVLGMLSVSLQQDGTRLDLYPKQNLRTILQRVSAALIFPLLILHLYTFSFMQASAEEGQALFIFLLIFAEIIFFAAVLTHVATSLTKGFVTHGLLSSPKKQKILDLIIYILCGIIFVVSVYVIAKTQAAMFLH